STLCRPRCAALSRTTDRSPLPPQLAEPGRWTHGRPPERSRGGRASVRRNRIRLERRELGISRAWVGVAGAEDRWPRRSHDAGWPAFSDGHRSDGLGDTRERQRFDHHQRRRRRARSLQPRSRRKRLLDLGSDDGVFAEGRDPRIQLDVRCDALGDGPVRCEVRQASSSHDVLRRLTDGACPPERSQGLPPRGCRAYRRQRVLRAKRSGAAYSGLRPAAGIPPAREVRRDDAAGRRRVSLRRKGRPFAGRDSLKTPGVISWRASGNHTRCPRRLQSACMLPAWCRRLPVFRTYEALRLTQDRLAATKDELKRTRDERDRAKRLSAHILAHGKLKDILRAHTDAYRSAEPFPHVVIEELVDPALLRDVVSEFDAMDRTPWHHTERATERKYSTEEFQRFGPTTRSVMSQLNAAPFMAFLEKLTGIAGLIPDPHLRGGGLHEIRRGGSLGVHADFNFYKRLNLFRRLNLL